MPRQIFDLNRSRTSLDMDITLILFENEPIQLVVPWSVARIGTPADNKTAD